jgi:hypothetical protein
LAPTLRRHPAPANDSLPEQDLVLPFGKQQSHVLAVAIVTVQLKSRTSLFKSCLTQLIANINVFNQNSSLQRAFSTPSKLKRLPARSTVCPPVQKVFAMLAVSYTHTSHGSI